MRLRVSYHCSYQCLNKENIKNQAQAGVKNSYDQILKIQTLGLKVKKVLYKAIGGQAERETDIQSEL